MSVMRATGEELEHYKMQRRIAKAKPLWRRILDTASLGSIFFALLLILLVVVTPLLILFTQRGVLELSSDQTQQILLSSAFSKGVRVEDPHKSVHVYLFPSGTQPNAISPLSYNDKWSLRQSSHRAVPFWLNKGSTVKTTFASNYGMMMFVFKGESNYKKWKAGSKSKTWEMQRFAANGNMATNAYEVLEDGKYYFAFFNMDQQHTSDIAVEINLQRMVYSPRDAMMACQEVMACELTLPYLTGGNQPLVIVQAPPMEDVGPRLKVRYYGHPRLTQFALVFFPIGILIAICWICCDCHNSSNIQNAAKNGIVGSFANAYWGTFSRGPKNAHETERLLNLKETKPNDTPTCTVEGKEGDPDIA